MYQLKIRMKVAEGALQEIKARGVTTEMGDQGDPARMPNRRAERMEAMWKAQMEHLEAAVLTTSLAVPVPVRETTLPVVPPTGTRGDGVGKWDLQWMGKHANFSSFTARC